MNTHGDESQTRDHTLDEDRGAPARSRTRELHAGEPTPGDLLFDALSGEPAAPAEELARLSAATVWQTVPRTVQPIALASARPVARIMPVNILWRTGGGQTQPFQCGLIPNPSSGVREAMQRLLHGRTAAIGPVVAAERAGAALRWTRTLLDLTRDSPAFSRGVVCVEEHLASVLLMQDTGLADLLVSHCLTPLLRVAPPRRRRLGLTMLAWLQEGSALKAAKVLDVHPQTVRYRMRQVEKMFGRALYEPRSRLQLTLALSYLALTTRSGLGGLIP